MSAGVKISERTRKRLADFLGSLPGPHARALADCVEEARLCGDAGLPHELILEALQPALERDVPELTFGKGLTAAELFAFPFEDLIVERRYAKRPGRIARASVDAVWAWLSAEGPGRITPDGLLHGLGNGGGVPRAEALEFYRACRETVIRLISDEDALEALRASDGPDVVKDAQEMAALLEIAEDAIEIREKFPHPHGMLSASTVNALAVMFDDFADRHPARSAQFFLVLAGRLEKPWEVLRVMDQVAGQVHATQLDAACTDAVLEALFADLDAEAEFFRRLNTSVFDPAEVAGALRKFTRLVDGLSRAGFPEGGRWARRMAACRSDVAEKMEILMERGPRDIMSALPVHKIGRFGRVRCRPDIAAAPDPAKSERALRMAELFEVCRPYAADAAFKAALSEAAAETREGLREYAGALIETMARSNAESVVCARTWLDLVTRLTAYAAGAEEAGRLRRDAVALGAEDLPGVAAS